MLILRFLCSVDVYLFTGSSGSVIEALHVPTLTLVALKMLPIHNDQEVSRISRELHVLRQNVAQLRILTGSFKKNTPKSDTTNMSGCTDGEEDFDCIDEFDRNMEEELEESDIICPCPHLLAMYDGRCF